MLPQRKIVLASTSPRRVQLLKQLGVAFECFSPNVLENCVNSDPVQRVKENAEKKIRSAMPQYRDAVIIAADTIVYYEGVIFEKPKDSEDAIKMLTTLSGKTHIVFSAVMVLDSLSGCNRVEVEKTSVKMKSLSQQEIFSYVSKGEPMDKAGAYAAQGFGAILLECISGCFYNVVGLPLPLLYDMLKGFEINLLTDNKSYP